MSIELTLNGFDFIVDTTPSVERGLCGAPDTDVFAATVFYGGTPKVLRFLVCGQSVACDVRALPTQIAKRVQHTIYEHEDLFQQILYK